MSTASVDDEYTTRRAVHPDAVLLLPFGIHTQGIVRGIADLENGGRFEKRAGKEEFKEGDEPGAEKSGDSDPYQPPALPIDVAGLGTHGGQTAGRRMRRLFPPRLWACRPRTGAGKWIVAELQSVAEMILICAR